MSYAQESAPAAQPAQAAAQPDAKPAAKSDAKSNDGAAAPTGAQPAAVVQSAAKAEAAPAKSAVQAAPAETPSGEAVDLDFKKANAVAKGGLRLEVAHAHPDDESSPVKVVTLRGKIYKDCVSHFSVSNTRTDDSVEMTGSIGFRITDDGQGEACVKAHKNVACSPSTCVSLASQFDGATMDLAGYEHDAKIGLIFVDPNKDPGITFQNVGDEVKFVSEGTIRKQIQDAAESRRQARIETNEERFKSCRHNLDELAVASKALNELIRDTHMAIEDQREKRAELRKVQAALVKKQVQAQLKELQKKIAKVKSGAEAEDLSQEISDFADEHPEMAKSARQLQEDLIRQLRDNVDDSSENFAARKAIYENLMGMEGVTAAEARSYRVQMNGLDIAQQALALQSGSLNSNGFGFYSFWNSYQKMYQTTQKDYSSACRNTKANAMSDACEQAMKNMAAVQQLPQAAVSAAQQQQQQQMVQQQQQIQMQSQLQQYMNQTMNVGNQAAQNPGLMAYRSGPF